MHLPFLKDLELTNISSNTDWLPLLVASRLSCLKLEDCRFWHTQSRIVNHSEPESASFPSLRYEDLIIADVARPQPDLETMHATKGSIVST